MLNYDDWIFEFHDQDPSKGADLRDSIDKIKNDLEKTYGGGLNIIPDFENFVRPGEPLQRRVLFTAKPHYSFNANFTESGQLYSVDFFKSERVGPVMTMYIKKGGVSQIAKLIPIILKDPKPLKPKQITSILTGVAESELNEADEENQNVQVTFKVPPQQDAIPKPQDDMYEYGDPDIVFNDLALYVQMVIDGNQPSLVITGSPGVGKTHLVTQQLKSNNVEYSHVKGRSTAAGLYIALYENKDKITLIDDCDSIFKNEDAINILKGALDSYEDREISWLVGKPLISASGQKIPTKFTFKGGVIFISNLPQKKIDYAIKSRSVVIEVALTPEDMIKRMQSLLPDIYKEVPLSVRRTGLKLIESAYNSGVHVELSMRTLIKAIKILEIVDDLSDAKRLIIQQCSYK